MSGERAHFAPRDARPSQRRRLGTLCLIWFATLLLGLAVGAPFALVADASGLGHFPRGDALLWEPGGTWLVEVARVARGSLAVAGAASGVVFTLALGVTLALKALWLAALATRGRLSLRPWLGTSAVALPRLLALAGLFLALRALPIALGVLGVAHVRSGALASLWALGERGRELAALGVLFAALALWLVLGALETLADATVVARDACVTRALGAALACLWRRPVAVAVAWLWPTTAGVGVVLAAALAAHGLDVGEPEVWRLGAVLGVHQLALFALLALRGAWFAQALTLAGAPASAAAS